jgi:hypothetical protein
MIPRIGINPVGCMTRLDEVSVRRPINGAGVDVRCGDDVGDGDGGDPATLVSTVIWVDKVDGGIGVVDADVAGEDVVDDADVDVDGAGAVDAAAAVVDVWPVGTGVVITGGSGGHSA